MNIEINTIHTVCSKCNELTDVLAGDADVPDEFRYLCKECVKNMFKESLKVLINDGEIDSRIVNGKTEYSIRTHQELSSDDEDAILSFLKQNIGFGYNIAEIYEATNICKDKLYARRLRQISGIEYGTVEGRTWFYYPKQVQ